MVRLHQNLEFGLKNTFVLHITLFYDFDCNLLLADLVPSLVDTAVASLADKFAEFILISNRV